MAALVGGESSGQSSVRSYSNRNNRAGTGMSTASDDDIFRRHRGLLYIDPSQMTPHIGLEAVKFENIGKPKFVQELVEELALQSNDGTGEGYIAFKGVNEAKFDAFVKLTKKENWQYKVRLTWFEEESLMIIKTPTEAHEVASRGFEKRFFDFLLNRLGADYENKIKGTGSTTYKFGRVIKEADASFRLTTRNEVLPIIVVEVGVTESLRRLRNDAFLWLERSNGVVKVVIIIKVIDEEKRILIEKWTRVAPPANFPRPVSRANPYGMNPFPTTVQSISIYEIDTPDFPAPRQIQPNNSLKVIPEIAPAGTTVVNPASTCTIRIDPADDAKSYRVVGAPLLIRFEETFNCNPNALEGDMVMGGVNLATLACDIFNALS